MNIRSMLCAAVTALVAVTGLGAPLQAIAQEKFDRPVRILVGFPAGGTVDLIARVVADKMKDSLGQPVIVENKPARSAASPPTR